MALTSEQYTQIITDKAAEFPELSELEANPSRVPEWLYIKQVQGFLWKSIAEMVDQHKAETDLKIVQQETGTLSWYRDKVLAYQHGDPLTLINNVPGYNLPDPAKQIIAHASLKEVQVNDETVIDIKVAKANGDDLEAIDVLELAGLQTYLAKIKFAGTKLLVQSLPPDQVYYDLDIEVDQTIIGLDGKRLDGTTDTPILDAIGAFHKSIGEDGVLYLSKVVDALQSISGVIDVEMSAAFYSDNGWQAINRKWESPATYMELDVGQTIINYS